MKKRIVIVIFATLLFFVVGGLGAYLRFISRKPINNHVTPPVPVSSSSIATERTHPSTTTETKVENPVSSRTLHVLPGHIFMLAKDVSKWKTYMDISKWKTYTNTNEKYGYKIKYPPEAELTTYKWDDKSIMIDLTRDATLYVDIIPNLSPPVFYNPNAGDIWSLDKAVPTMITKTKKMTINGIPWTIVYTTTYGGMGDWEDVITASTQKGKFLYAITIDYDFQAMKPGEVIGITSGGEYKKVTYQDIAQPEVKKMVSGKPAFVRLFFQILESFRFT